MSRAKGRSQLRLHPQHGLNPTMPLCFWCGKPNGEIALLGAAYKREAPMNMALDYDPCDDCKAKMALGVVVVQCSQGDGKRLNRHIPDSVPTGRWVVLKREAAQRMFGDTEQWHDIERKGQLLMNIETWTTLGFPTDPAPGP